MVSFIQTSSPSFRSANIDHRTSFRADHNNFCSRSSRANSKLLPLLDAVIPCTRLMLSFTLVLVPANLKNSVGASFHTRGAVAPPRLITFICTSSITSIEATGIPACIIPAAAEAASRMVGKLTTATDVSSGTMASLRVARCFIRFPLSVSSYGSRRTFGDQTKRSLAPYKDAVEIVPGRALPRASSRLDDRAIGQDYREIDNPVLHRAVPHRIGA